MRNMLVGAAAGFTIGWAALIGVAVTVSNAPLVDNSTTNVEHNGFDYSQEAFPCEEDQALQFDPRFGSELVGCVSLDR